MGRWSTGAVDTREANRLELKYLLKNGYIKKGRHIGGSLSWTDGSTCGFESKCTEEEQWIRLKYNLTTRSGEKFDYDYKIYLTSIPSNLGFGEVLYFICPASGRMSRVLYRCYGYNKYKCREAYSHKIYYRSQTVSKRDLPNTNYHWLNKQINDIEERGYKKNYKERPTRIYQRLQKLKDQRDLMDDLRTIELYKVLKISGFPY